MSASKAAILENFSERTLPPSAAEAAPSAAKAAARAAARPRPSAEAAGARTAAECLPLIEGFLTAGKGAP